MSLPTWAYAPIAIVSIYFIYLIAACLVGQKKKTNNRPPVVNVAHTNNVDQTDRPTLAVHASAPVEHADSRISRPQHKGNEIPMAGEGSYSNNAFDFAPPSYGQAMRD